MKTVLVFIGLKIAELIGLCLAVIALAGIGYGMMQIPYFSIQKEIYITPFNLTKCFVPCLMTGIMSIIMAILAMYVIVALILLVLKNWDWAKDITNDKK